MPRKFRSRNLAGSILTAERLAALLPKLQICLLRTCHWLPRTCVVGSLPCLPHTQVCEVLTLRGCGGWSVCGGSLFRAIDGRNFDLELYDRQLAALRADLRDALAEVQVHEKAIAGAVREASALALDQMEAGLKDALRQVAEIRQQRRR